MLVCHCQAVNARTIKGCIRDGAHDIEQVAEACGAGTGCGGCHPLIDELIEEKTTDKRRSLLPLLAASLP